MEHKRDSFLLANKKGKKYHQENGQNGNKEEFKKKKFNQLNKNRVGVMNNEDTGHKDEKPEKKPFDKKTYRLKKYSKKYKLEQWEEQRKKKLKREYEKSMKKDPMMGSYKPVSFDEDITDSNQDVGKFVRHPDLIENEEPAIQENQQTKRDPFKKAKEQYNKVKQDKLQKQQEIEQAREEKRKKLQEYKRKKQERFKKLSKKTKKGQPMMKGRLELMLEKIQKNK
ncbi:rRNA processing domain-containing protein [Phthorimaea operculella]|nr:rRNA processing domain-containing protein [Phthorimaea operculella]